MSGDVRMNQMIGREAELRDLIDTVNQVACDVQTRLVLVAGVAGIGKSRLLSEVVEQACAPALIAQADPVDQNVPFGMFRDGLIRLQIEADKESDLAASVAACLAELDASTWRAATASPSPVNAIFSALCSVLADLARASNQTVIVGLEDLHDADPDSVALLYRLARHVVNVPVMIIATSRPETNRQQIRPFVERLALEGRGSLVELGPLTRDQIGELVNRLAGVSALPGLVSQVYEGSQGNPFFAETLWATAAAGGSEAVRASLPGERLPSAAGKPTGADLLSRFFISSQQDWLAAGSLALLGRVSVRDIEVFGAMTDLAGPDLTACLNRLEGSGLLAARGQGEYAFAHGLLRSAVLARMGPAQTALLHGKAASAMAAKRDCGDSFDPFAYATHIYHSMAPDDPRLVTSAMAAAELSIGAAPLVAAEWFDRAATALDGDPTKAFMVRAQQTMALLTGYDSRGAFAVGKQTLVSAPAGVPRSRLALATATAASSSDLLPDALALLDGELGQDPENVALQVSRTLILSQLGRAKEAASAYAAVAAQAKSTDPVDPFTGAWTFATLYAYAEQVALIEDRTLFAARAREEAEKLPAFAQGGMLLYLNTQVGANPGSFARADAELTKAAQLLGRTTGPFTENDVRVDVPTFGWFQGNWDTTLESIRTHLAFSAQGSNKTAAEVARSVGILILTDRGEYAAAAQLAEDLALAAELGRSLAAIAKARLARSRGSVAAALETLRERRAEMDQRGVVRMYSLVTEELVALELANGDRAQAQLTADAAWSATRRAESQILDLWAARAVAAAHGNVDQALLALAIATREDLPFEVAKCRLILGELDHWPAENLRAAIATFDKLGAKPWRRRAGAAMRAMGLAVPRKARRTDELSPTEQEIIGLLGQRLTNRQIAGVLRYSEKTVEAYLSRIYAKTDTANRAELVQAISDDRPSVGFGVTGGAPHLP